ncbi:MAG TPA: Rrf2 family transcriptional regulator [Solirubrobacteraceae bacterium]|nr:Rrf2 family transcriptional regulator [Solirubrobacteraceae bacterium]
MIFSSKSEYGVRVMVALARHADLREEGSPEALSLAEIAAEHAMPLAYLEHLVARLRRAGLIDSRRGARGGYLLARPAEQISLAEIIEALEGVIAPIECISLSAGGELICARESESQAACPTKLLWTRVRGAILTTLHETTLAELLAGAQSRPTREPLTTGA